MDFNVLKNAVAGQFERMQRGDLFRVQVERNDLWDIYLGSFPKGTDPMFRKRTEHDCACCRQFIRAIGDVVAVVDGKLVSIWDVDINEPAYQVVADALAAFVKTRPIADAFLHSERTIGTDKNFEQMVDLRVHTWQHFFVNLKPAFLQAKANIPTKLGELRTTQEMLLRSLRDFTLESIDTVLELIAQKSLYRGDEHKFVLTEFRQLKVEFAKLKNERAREIFAWTAKVPASVARIRGTAIGTLLEDLSCDRELEQAVAAFEQKVAPTNYKRPTALITKGMIENAKKKLEELGLTSALERRYATINDITINNILFADREARGKLTGNVFDDLTAQTPSEVKNLDRVEVVPIDRFIAEILPRAESIEVLLENSQVSNLVSLIAPVDATAGGLFKWPNNFSWSYNGELADSIKERVKKAGGNVTGDLCCRLAWFNHDDLDLHMEEPKGYEIYYGSRGRASPSGGKLDVDMNVAPTTRKPVENIFYENRATMRDGVYTLRVHQFTKREAKDVGFEVQIDYLGTLHHFVYSAAVPQGKAITVAKMKFSKKEGLQILESLPSSKAVRNTWGLSTETFHKVKVMMLSPNHWDERAVGNKHYFFMLDGCVNDGIARGFFNEFLKDSLNEHRKVFEVVGSKMTVAPSNEQLSGLGFSTTQRNTLVCRVRGSFSRIIKIAF